MRGRDLINSQLPEELIRDEIFRRLELKSSRDACSLVCKKWLEIDRMNRKTLRIDALFSSDDQKDFFANLSTRLLDVTSVHLELPSSFPLVTLSPSHKRKRGKTNSEADKAKSCYLNDTGLIALADGFKKIEILNLIWCQKVSSVGIHYLVKKCKSLKSLHLKGCSIRDQSLAVIGKFCKHLEEFKLGYSAHVTDAGVNDLVFGHGKSLKSFGVSTSAKITDLSLEAVGSQCKLLETLSLDNKDIHDKGLIAVARGCNLLKYLKVAHASVTDEAFFVVGKFCSSLEQLYLYRLQHLTDKGMEAIGKLCKKLNKLCLPRREQLSLR